MNDNKRPSAPAQVANGSTGDNLPSIQQVATPPSTKPWRTVAIVALVLVIIAVLAATVVGLATHPRLTAVLRDISIIAMAILTMVTLVFLVVLLFQLQTLIVMLRTEVLPILRSVNDTAGTVRGTTVFVSDSVVQPMITISSYLSAVQATFQTLVGGSRRSKGFANRRSGDGQSVADMDPGVTSS